MLKRVGDHVRDRLNRRADPFTLDRGARFEHDRAVRVTSWSSSITRRQTAVNSTRCVVSGMRRRQGGFG